MKTAWLYFFSFISGYLIMSLELVGFRLLSPYFGYSLDIFGSLIGLILLSLAIGYFFGGYFADKNLSFKKLLTSILAGGLYLYVVSSYSSSILSASENLGSRLGSIVSSLVIFFIPMAILASIYPFFVKKLSTNNGVGISSGLVYAISTAGSLFGTFLTAFYLVPELGSKITLYLNSFLMIISSVIVLFLSQKEKRGFIALILLMLPLGAHTKSDPSVVYQTDSKYNHLEVVNYQDYLALRIDNKSHTIYSYYPESAEMKDRLLFYDLFSIGPIITSNKNILLLGLGAGTIPHVHNNLNPDVNMDGVEIDDKIIAIGKRHFKLNEINNLNIINQDARPFLSKTAKKYGVIEIDMFWGGPNIPFYLATSEFFKSTRNHLDDDGLIAMNVYDPSGEIILNPILNTISSVFTKTYYIKFSSSSYLVLGLKKDISVEELRSKLGVKFKEKKMLLVADYVKTNIKEYVFNTSLIVLTDDLSSIDKRTNQVFRD